MEENNNVQGTTMNLGGNVAQPGVTNTQPVQPQQPMYTPQPVQNNVQPTPQPVEAPVSNIPTGGIPEPVSNVAPQSVSTTIPQPNEPVSYVAPVTQTAPQVEQQSYTIPAQQIPAQQVAAQQVPAQEQPVQEPVKQAGAKSITEPTEPIVSKKYIIKRAELVKMINNASKLAIGIDGLTLTTLFQLVFTSEGLIMKATDNDNIITQINRSVKYEDEISLSVSAAIFSELISKLTSEYIELKPDLETRTIEIHSGKNMFKIPELYDNDSGEAINIEDTFANANGQTIAISIEELKSRINEANTFMGSENVQSFLAGVYCADRIYSTDRENMFATPNIPQLINEQFFLTKKYATALTGIGFEGEGTITLIKADNGECTGISLKTNTITLSGPTNPEKDQYPFEVIKGLIERNFDNIAKIDANELLTFAQIGKIFLQPGSDKEAFVLNTVPETKMLNIRNQSTATDMYLALDTDFVPQKRFWLHIPSLIKALNNIERANVSIVFGNVGVQGESFIRLESGDVVELISMKELE